MKSKTMVMACSRHRFCFSSLSVCMFLGFSVLYSFLVFLFVRSWFSGLSLCLSASGSLSLSYFAFVLASCVVPVFFFSFLSLSVFFSLSFSLWGLSLAFIKPGRSYVHASRNEACSVRDHGHRGPWSAGCVSCWSGLQDEEMINSVGWKRHRFHTKWLFLIWPLNFWHLTIRSLISLIKQFQVQLNHQTSNSFNF